MTTLSQSKSKPHRIFPGAVPSSQRGGPIASGRTALADQSRDAARLAALPSLPRDTGGPVFAEPWQAQAFAMAVKLSEQGHFTWKEWAAALAAELKAAADRGESDVEPKSPVRRASAVIDDGSRYYEHWLAALEKLVIEKHLSDGAALAERKAAWVQAYLRTPHGKPVLLTPSDEPRT